MDTHLTSCSNVKMTHSCCVISCMYIQCTVISCKIVYDGILNIYVIAGVVGMCHLKKNWTVAVNFFLFLLLKKMHTPGSLFWDMVLLVQGLSTIFVDQLSACHVFRKVHSVLASKLSAFYRIVFLVLEMKRHDLR